VPSLIPGSSSPLAADNLIVINSAVYLKMRDITPKNILNAIEILARDGAYTIKQK